MNLGPFDRLAKLLGASTSRRRLIAASFAAASAAAGWSLAPAPTLSRASASGGSAPAADIIALVREIMAKNDLKAVILRVTIAGKDVVTQALGESMTGVPATPDMHFRNGAV